eukprot:TRINITY_DN4272_c0_g1_i1.p1 TRINITY_DN4272_c0_g1~~TRINITY_DN4272_c0_g1_i1.p1  ORF type:complete len:726 (-),score=108.65 TRINITY_DN4272_c0_g1_i1:69-2183(-)
MTAEEAPIEPVWRSFWKIFALPKCMLSPFQKNATRRNILIFLSLQVIEMFTSLWLYYFNRNIALLSKALPESELVWGIPRWRFLFLLGLFGLFITCIGLAGTFTRRHTILIPFFCMNPIRCIVVGILIQPPLSMTCACKNKSYAQCAALHSFEDKERKFDSHYQDPFDPKVPIEYTATLDFPKAVPFSEASSLIERISVIETSRGYRKTMPKRALGDAILQAGMQEAADATKLEPAQSDSNPQYPYAPGVVQQGWVHPALAASQHGMAYGAGGPNGQQAPGSFAMTPPYSPSSAARFATNYGSPQMPIMQQGVSSIQNAKDVNCTEILARVSSSSLLEAPSQTQPADDAKPKMITPEKQLVNQMLLQKMHHVTELNRLAADAEADLCRDLQNAEGAQQGNLKALSVEFKSTAEDAERAKLRKKPGGLKQPHVGDSQDDDVKKTELETRLYLEEACRCEYPNCFRTDERGSSHWCYVDQSTLPDCRAKNFTLFRDPDNVGKVWTKDLCTAPCECINHGLKPPRLTTAVPKDLEKAVAENPYFYGSQCEKWDAGDGNTPGDIFEWCYVGLDTTCEWRDKYMAPHDLHRKWYYRSFQACASKDQGIIDSCRMFTFYFLFIGIVEFICFWALMLMLYFFIGNHCGDFIAADQDFVANITDSEDEDAHADAGDKEGAARGAENAEESDSEEEEEEEDARKDSERPPRKH